MPASKSNLIWQSSAAPTHGAVGDANTMRISPDSLGMAQDVILDTSGILRSRGAIASVTTDTFTSNQLYNACQVITGTALISAQGSTTANFLYGTSSTDLTGFAKLTASGYSSGVSQAMVQSLGFVWGLVRQPDDTGAIMCGQPAFWSGGSSCATLLWGGNSTVVSDTTTGTAASTVGSITIVGVGTGWTSSLVGCYLFIGAGAAAKYVGQVAKVASTTSLTLKKGALITIGAAAPAFKTTRQVQAVLWKGRITTNTASATVVGSNTHWTTPGPAFTTTSLSSGQMFRYSDGAYVGTVSAINNDTTITLVTSAAIALVNEEYYVINNNQLLVAANPSAGFSSHTVSYFSGRYWYGGILAADNITFNPVSGVAAYQGTNVLAFTKKDEPEMLDLDPIAGDIIPLPYGDNPDFIRGLYAIKGGLVVFRAHDAFLLTGYAPENFRLVKISDDGAYNVNTIEGYREGVIWAGTKSMWYFDGSKVSDLLANTVKKFFQKSIAKANLSGSPGLGISNDHVLLSYVNGVDPTWPYKNTTRNYTNVTMVVNLLNGAISFFTNILVTTSFKPRPTSSGDYTSVLLTRTFAGSPSNTSYLVNGNKIFTDSSTAANNFDAITSVASFPATGAQVGPDVMFETTKITFGDATLLKTFKRFLMNYSSAVGMTASIISTNDTTVDFPNIGTGTVSTDTFAVSSNVGILHRLRFLCRTPAVSVRVYQTATTTATSQRFKAYWYSIGGKRMRAGRVQP